MLAPIFSRRSRLLLCLGLLATGGRAAEGFSRQQLEDLFQRDRIIQVALAPDGAHFAYAVREGRTVGIAIAPVEAPEQRKLVRLGVDEMGDIFRRRVTFPVEVTLLRWASERQLLYGVSSREGGRQRRDELRSIDADGTNDRLLLNAIDLDFVVDEVIMPRYPQAMRWSAAEAGTLFFEAVDPQRSNLAARLRARPAPTALFALDVATGKHQRLDTQETNPRVIYDQQGRPRLRETERLIIYLEGPPMTSGSGESIRVPPPPPQVQRQRFEILEDGAASRWEDFDAWLGREAGVAFAHDDSNYWSRAIPLAFDRDPNILYYASNAGRDTFGLYALDLRTKRRTAFALEDPRVDLVDFTSAAPETALVFDRERRLAGVRVPGAPSRTRWLDAGLARLQGTLEQKFPARSVEILDWDTDRRRALALVSGPGDPGRYFVYEDGTPGRLTEMLRRANRLPAEMLGRAGTFEFTAPDGTTLTATLTTPRRAWVKQPPLVVLCPDLPAWRDDGRFARDAQALAAAGCLVLKVDYRGVSGYGTAHREAIRAGFDRVPIGDLRAAIDALAARHTFDRRRVALVGEGFGGYLALRALQLHPGEFRGAVTFNAPTDLAWWATQERGKLEGAAAATGANVDRPEIVARRLLFGADKEKLAASSVLTQASLLKQPILIVQEAQSNLWPSHGTLLRDRLKRTGAPVQFADLEPQEDRSTPEGSAQIYRRATEFLIEMLYDFNVKLGQEKEVP